MEVQPVHGEVSSSPNGINDSKGEVTQEAFLKLLVVQLQHQDPLNPLDNQEFIAQLATFNSVEQLVGINGKLDSLRSDQLGLRQIEATSFLGREVTTTGNRISFQGEEATEVHYNLSADASRVVVNITDRDGSLVRALELGSQGAGEQTVTWDGRDGIGNPLIPGVYRFEANAFDAGGNIVKATPLIRGAVTGINMVGGEPLLELGDVEISIGAVLSVKNGA